MRLRIIVLGSCAFLLLWGGAANACTTPNWLIAEPAGPSGVPAPGEPLFVRGGGYAAGPVELRWGGLDGDLLASPEAGADGRFSVEVTVPEDAVEGRKPVTGVQPTPEGTRLWGFTEIVVVPAAAAPLLPAEALGGLALGALLLSYAVVLLLRRRSRAVERVAPVDLDAALDRLLADADSPSGGPEREPVAR